ncbi:UNVERIFIED_CONTAM: hypothetical protein K2H54_060392 [Gekko kuhli]
MKKLLVLAFSALLCLTVVQCFWCRNCHLFVGGKCLMGDNKCYADPCTEACVTLLTSDNEPMGYGCTSKKKCPSEPNGIKRINSNLRSKCCYTNFCNTETWMT